MWFLPTNVTVPAVRPVEVLLVKPSLVDGLSDGHLALIAPVVAYWLLSGLFFAADHLDWWHHYRIHELEEVKLRNKACPYDVLREVVQQHIVQSVVGLMFVKFDGPSMTGFELGRAWDLKHSHWLVERFVPDWVVYLAATYLVLAIKILVGFVVIDTWQYWCHRTMHMNKWLYRTFHSRHHRLYVPYAFGALYNHPVEGFLLDTVGTGIAAIVTMQTPREQLVMYTLATLKTVDDHCGYALPWDLYRWVFPNNLIYHDIHHQMWGIKTNFSQPFFCFWDKVTKTEFQMIKGDRVGIDEYHEFLHTRGWTKKQT